MHLACRNRFNGDDNPHVDDNVAIVALWLVMAQCAVENEIFRNKSANETMTLVIAHAAMRQHMHCMCTAACQIDGRPNLMQKIGRATGSHSLNATTEIGSGSSAARSMNMRDMRCQWCFLKFIHLRKRMDGAGHTTRNGDEQWKD